MSLKGLLCCFWRLLFGFSTMPDCYFQKTAGGILLPADDETADYLTSIKTGTYLKSKITKPRNYIFHKKVFGFFNFCFEHWAAEISYQFMDERAQKNAFRKQLTILAGYRIAVTNLRTKTVGYEAQSLAFDNMEEDEFRLCYVALTQAAMGNIFQGSDELIYNKLVSFF
jgi:hypothetical protein